MCVPFTKGLCAFTLYDTTIPAGCQEVLENNAPFAPRRGICYNLFRFFLENLLLFSEMCAIIIRVAQGYSSAGRVPVSKTVGRGFESSCPCQKKKPSHRLGVFFWHEVRGETRVQVAEGTQRGIETFGEKEHARVQRIKGQLDAELRSAGFRILLALRP